MDILIKGNRIPLQNIVESLDHLMQEIIRLKKLISIIDNEVVIKEKSCVINNFNNFLYDGNILFDTGLCPSCGSSKCRIEKTTKPTRKKYCQVCKAEWKTITINLWDPQALEKAAALSKQFLKMKQHYPFL